MLAFQCISYIMVATILIIGGGGVGGGEEVNRGQLCPFMGAWVMSGKVSQRQPGEIGSSDLA